MAKKILFSLFCLLIIIMTVRSQDVTGNLEGYILDSQGEPLALVNIFVEGSNLQGIRRASSDNQGFFRVLALPVGVYSVKIIHDFYQTVTFRDISIQLGKTRSLGEVRLQMGVVDRHEIVISAEKPLLDPSSTELGSNLDSVYYEALPIERNYRSVATILSHVNTSYFGDEANFAGATGLENKYFIDGVDVTDPYRGITGTNLPYNFVQEIEVRAGGYQAEYRSSLGGVMNVITFSGGNEFHGQAFGFFLNNRFTSEPRKGAFEPNKGDFTQYDFGLSLGGPIIRDKLWFFSAYNPTFNREDVEIPGLEFFNDHTTTHSFACKFTWQLDERTNIFFTVFGDPSKRQGVGETFGSAGLTPVAFNNPDPYLSDIEKGGINLSLNGRHVVGSNFIIDTSITRITRKEKNVPVTEKGRDEPLFIDAQTGIWSGGTMMHVDNLSIQTTLGVKGTFLLGRHTVKTGLEFRDNKLEYNTEGEILFRFSATNYLNWITSTTAVLRNRIPSLFIQDSWRITDKMVINAGLRWDGQLLVGSDGKVAQKILTQYQPRIGIVFQPGKIDTQKIFGSVGRYYQELALHLSTSHHVEGGVFRLTAYDHDPRIDPSGGFTFLDMPGSIHPEVKGLEGQYYDEFTLGYERVLAHNYKLGLRGIYRSLRQGIEDGYDPNTGEQGYGNPGKGKLSAFPRMKREYTALELTFERYGGKKFNFLSSYVLSRNYGNYPGLFNSDFNWDFPNSNGSFDYLEILINATGLLPNDRTHVFKFSGSYRFNFGLTTGISIFWQSGTPLSEFGGSSLEGQFNFIEKRGTAGRTPSIFDANLRFVYDLSRSMRTGWTQKLILDIFHVGSQRTPVNYEQVHYFNIDENGNQINPNPNYGRATRYLPPMSVRLGIELSF